MLRPLRSAVIGARILPFRGTNDGSDSVDSTYGAQDITFGYTSSGVSTLTYGAKAGRGSVVIATPGTNVADAGYATLSTTIGNTSATSFVVNTVDAAGAADAGTFYGMAINYGSSSALSYGARAQEVYGSVISGRLLTFDLAAAGTLTKGRSDATVTVNGTGDYTLTFTIPFGSGDVIPCATVVNAAGGSVIIESVSATAVNVKTFDETDAAADLNVHVFVFGQHTNTEIGKRFTKVGITQPKPRMVCGLISNTAGTYAAVIGSGDFTLTDNGAGDLTVTFANAFARAPQIVAIAGGARCFMAAAPTATAVNFLTTDAAYVASESHISFVAIGSDNAWEY